ncbi:MAG: helix-turn-helix domain-containing protein [Firmicutes bacterium]|nr:helix-turn-helix domain-containing protein [Bacillota bacterium]
MIRFKLWRLQERLTQSGAAERLGIGESTLAMLESGRLRPTDQQIDQLRMYFGDLTESLFDQVSERVEVAQ